MKRMYQRIREWHLPRQTSVALHELAAHYNPTLRGWLSYYGRLYRSALQRVFFHFSAIESIWATSAFSESRDGLRGGIGVHWKRQQKGTWRRDRSGHSEGCASLVGCPGSKARSNTLVPRGCTPGVYLYSVVAGALDAFAYVSDQRIAHVPPVIRLTVPAAMRVPGDRREVRHATGMMCRADAQVGRAQVNIRAF
jgi:Group II intron, maturase-specific domain